MDWRTGLSGGASEQTAMAQLAGGTDADGVSAAVEQVGFPTVVTDKDDYQPTDIVHLTGTGFEADEWVDIYLIEEPATHDVVHYEVQADHSGGFHEDIYEVQEHDLGVRC